MIAIRHRARLLSAAVLVLLVATACGDASDSSSPGGAGEGNTWSFPRDDGTSVTLDARPTRIVMFEDVAASLMDLGVRPVGIHYINGKGGNQLFEGVNLDGIATVGEGCEVVNVEAVAALRPNLLIYMAYDEERFCLTAEQVAQLERIAPILAIQSVGEADRIRARYVDLAKSLGADLSSNDVEDKRKRFDAAAKRLEAVVAKRPEISVVPVAVAPDYAGIAEPAAFADLRELRDRFGVSFVGPFAPDGETTGTYWQEVSAETIADFRGDVILIDSKNVTPLADKLAAYPLWAKLPEVAAKQFVSWFVPGSFSYTRDAQAMETLADGIEAATDFVNPQRPR